MHNEYVLVHGAAHGAWCWDEVAERLEAKGHRVIALDLPGHGRRAAEVRQASVATYARAVADAMALEGISRGIVVGHSMGGIVISKAAELVPWADRPSRLSRCGGAARWREFGRHPPDGGGARGAARHGRRARRRDVHVSGRDRLGAMDD